MTTNILVKDGRMRPVLRVLLYCALVVLVGSAVVPFATTLRASEFLSAAVAVVCAVVLRVFVDRRSVASLGISFRGGWAWLFVLGVALGAAMQLLGFGVELLLGNSHVSGLAVLRLESRTFLAWIFIFVMAALAEEYSLRGYTLQNLWEEAGFWPAAIATALFFAWLHVHNPNFGEHPWIAAAIIAGDGIWACLAVRWTGSLWLAWGAHFAWNLFEGPVLGLPVSGINTGASVITQTVTGPTTLTGGAFGPEAGWVALFAELAGLGVLYALYRAGAFRRLPDEREAYAR